MRLEMVVKKIVKTETDDGTSWRVYCEDRDGNRLSMPFDSEPETFNIGLPVKVDVSLPQTKLG